MKPFSLLLAMILLASAGSMSFAGWSVNNPYRTFNLSGLNYGAQNWEQQHRGQRGTGGAVRYRRLWRR